MTEIKQLLENGANPNSKNERGFTLLMSFAQKNDVRSVETLLSYGATPKSVDLLGFTAMDYAILADALDVVKLLIQYGTIVTNDNYMLAISKKRKDIVDYFDTLDENKQVFLKKKKK